MLLGTPLYHRVAETIRGRIADGRYPPGTELPAEQTLAAALGVSHGRLRAGLAVLRNEGLLAGQRGQPSRVREAPMRKPVDLPTGQAVISRMPTTTELRSPPHLHVGVAGRDPE